MMNGYVAQRRGRFYAVIYEGRDPITGREIRRWHPAGIDRANAEALARTLTAKEQERSDATRSLTFGACVAFTQDIYMHAIPAKEEAAADQIADMVFGNEQPGEQGDTGQGDSNEGAA
jgi:hypothetical protein